ncbi:hypothetical protein ABIB90_002709 [Bradyrhizobium sp. JR4.1]
MRRSSSIIVKETSFTGFFTKDIKSMEDLLLHGLQDIYYAEQQILKALPKMIEKATNKDLVAGRGVLVKTCWAWRPCSQGCHVLVARSVR